MNNALLKSIPLSSFNEEGWLKPPILIYLNLIILARGLLLFLASLASRGQKDSILSVFFPEKSMLYIAIAMSIIPIATLICFTLGKTQSYLNIKRILFILCGLQIIIELFILIQNIPSVLQFHELTSSLFILSYIIILVFSFASTKVKLFLSQLIYGKGVLNQTN